MKLVPLNLILCFCVLSWVKQTEGDGGEDVSPYETVVAIKRCYERNTFVCGFHKQHGRCVYSQVRDQCPCSCGDSNDNNNDNNHSENDDTNSNDDSNNADNNSGLSSAERIMLANQNSRRLHHNVSPFSYDVSLAQSAQDWCDTLAREDAFYHHDQSSKAFKDRIGENLYYSRGYAEDSIPARAIESWYDEIDYYDYSNPGNTKYEHYGKPIGHFTQIVWKGSNRVGCAVTKPYQNRQGKIFACCHYKPAGNIIGHYKEHVLRPKNGRKYVDAI